MINGISNVLHNSVDRFGITKYGIVCVSIGFVGYPLLKKVADLAIFVFNKIKEWWSKTTIGIRLHSLFCKDCAENHKLHMETPLPIDEAGQKKVNSGNG